MTQGEAIVQIARDWIGTPYHHQGSTCGAGADCLGLIRGVWRTLYGEEPEAMPAYTADWSEAGGTELLWTAAARHLTPLRGEGGPALGEVLLFRMRRGRVAKHLGIVTAISDRPHFVHAYSGHGVIESALTEPWRQKIVARFAFPEDPR